MCGTPLKPSSLDMIFIYTHFGVPILQSPGEPERAGEARRADSASVEKKKKEMSLIILVYFGELD